MSILPDELKNFNYYKNKLPLVLQNSYGFIEHFRIWYDLLTNQDQGGIVEIGDELLYLLNIFDDEYLATINNLPNASSGTVSDILDKLGNLFNIKRNVKVTYVNDQSQTVTEEISLNNNDFLIYIKCQIIKNYCNGTFKQISDYYESAGLLVYVITASASATCKLFLAEIPGYNYSSNIKKLFLGGLLRIESMGIIYQYANIAMNNFLVWDNLDNQHTWDYGVWTI